MAALPHAIPELDRRGLREFALTTGTVVALLFGLMTRPKRIHSRYIGRRVDGAINPPCCEYREHNPRPVAGPVQQGNPPAQQPRNYEPKVR